MKDKEKEIARKSLYDIEALWCGQCPEKKAVIKKKHWNVCEKIVSDKLSNSLERITTEKKNKLQH